MSRRVICTAAFVFVALFAVVPSSAQTFVFHLRGDQEVPPVPSVHTGGCMGTLNQPAATFSVTCVHDIQNATVMHIHRGAAGTNGDVVFDLGNPTSPVSATWSGMTPANIADLVAGNLYVNIHTGGRPAGEIRGQILPRTVDVVAFTADGSQVVPPGPVSATANCTADLSNEATSLAVSCTHNLANPLAAKIHVAPKGVNGPEIYTFPSPNSPLAGNVPLTPLNVANFAATFLYLQITSGGATEETAGPTIRGQIGTPPAGAGSGEIRIVKSTSPAGGTGFNFTDNVPGSPGTFALDDGGVRTFSSIAAGTYTITESALPANYALAGISCDDGNSSGNVSTRAATIDVAAGEVVTCTFRNALAAATDQNFIFHLSGDQEVPPVPSSARGGCDARFDAASSRLTIVCTHNVVGPTLMHIHRGAAGVNGDVLFDLGSPVSPVVATWIGMTPANVTDLLAGNLYVNIHTAGRPGGEIRGQILPRTVDLVNFTANAAQVVPPGTSSATATCTADLDGPATTIAINCTHTLPSPAAAHVHQAPRGANGPIVYTFPSATSPFGGAMPVTPRLIADYAAALLYLDIHGSGGTEATGNQIRGQIETPLAPVTTGTINIVKSTSPAGGSGFNFTDNVPGSAGAFTLSDGGTRTFANVAAGTYTIAEAVTAGYTVSDIRCTDGDSTANAFSRAATVRLQAGENVTCTFHNLQTLAGATPYVFHLSGAQEVPPVPTTARGGCMGQLDAANARFSLVCTHNVIGATIAHIHKGAPGAAGDIVFDLGTPESPIEATWTNMTPQNIADLVAGNLYVNIHAGGRPSGEIRGQIVPRSVDHFNFPMTPQQEVPAIASPSIGACSTDLSDNATSLFLQCQHNVPNTSDAHLHGAPAGFDGPVIFHLPLTPQFSTNLPLTPRFVADFAAGFLYTNVHSVDYPEGEIRGQLIAGAVSPVPPTVPIPTLSEWMLLLLAAAVTVIAALRLR